MTWWQAAGLVLGGIVILASGVMAGLSALWRRQEKRDGLR